MHINLRRALASATAAALAGGLLSLSAGSAATAAPAEEGMPSSGTGKSPRYADDFNGDGYRDYAVPRYPGFSVTYGTAKGPGTKTRHIDQNSPGIPGKTSVPEEENEAFGKTLATADLNGDGYADLAVGDSTETLGGLEQRGAVTIVWGSKTGLGDKATLVPLKNGRARQHVGISLTAGDFNGDAKPDLAVGDIDSVHIVRGSFSSSKGTTGPVTRHTVGGGKTLLPRWLAAGKVTGDKTDDLYVIGASEVWFLQGGKTVTSRGTTTYTKSDESNYYPRGVVADFDRNGYGELAIAHPVPNRNAGTVVVLRGGASGPKGQYTITQSTAGVATGESTADQFGNVISAGDVNRDTYPDLAVTAPGEKVSGHRSAGGVHLLSGGKGGLTGAKSQWFTRDTAGVPGKAKAWGGFGTYARLLDADRDGDADLFVSETEETSLLLPGGKSGITAKGHRDVPVTANFVQ
ncbi:FG-GAP and VCBS repeat-containing protein [Streptomyces sp. NPDC000594]|uniref:FG-GAP and VCBS repeat-containing protein n=1 Tax=Streptomyces sp. NPDC000594 TaxID=3154261 RepID=UPI00331A9AC0